MSSIGAAANVYNEANALPGWLENVSQFFDDIFVYHTGPGGKWSDDGTIELCEKWGVRIEFGAIDAGFGKVRTELIHKSTTEWVMILDADERFERAVPHIRHGAEGDHCSGVVDQAGWLRQYVANSDWDAIVTARRHWHDFSWTRPTQDWTQIPDWQARIVRNRPYLGYDASVKMHEQLVDFRTGQFPAAMHPDKIENCHLFHDHYHCWYKIQEPEQRAFDVQIYNALYEGRTVPMEYVDYNEDGEGMCLNIGET